MAGTGPTPKPDAQRRRRNATVSMTKLPAEGRSGKAPAWPLLPDIGKQVTVQLLKAQADQLADELLESTPRSRKRLQAELDKAKHLSTVLEAEIEAARVIELQLWADLWSTPQAVAWERLRYTREVAQYVRWKVRAELGDIKASTEARQLADRLGLSPLSMLRLRWEIAADEVAAARTTRAATTRRRAPRLRAVDNGSAAGR